MVARARGDAGVGQPALGGDRRDDRLRAVAAGHREPVGAALHRAADERLEVLAAASSSIGSIPRARASSASVKRSAFPPPERGL